MHFFTLAALVSAAAAQSIRGFNYGAIGPNGQPRTQQDFENEFNRAKNLKGTSGFTSGRLFTMIQGNTANTVSSAIPAAVATNTRLLLGLWASAGQASFDNEITALKTAISQFGTKFTDLIDGISVGSEDLYRVTPTGIANKAGVGSSPDELVKYIQQTRDAIKGTAASGKSIGHVDTWTAWVNGSNSAVTSAVDWLGMDGYPYYQTVNQNSIDNAESLFFESYNATVGASQGKPVWVTETGWPIQVPASGQATASIANAQRYWKAVACRLLGNVNTYWFTLDDTKTNPSDISFSIVGPNLGAELFDLSCAASAASSSTPAASSSRSVGPSVASSSAQAKPSGSTAPGTTTPVTDTLPTSQVAQPPKPSTLVSSVKSAAPSYAAPSATAYGTAASSPAAPSPSSPSTAPSGGKSCPANLNGQYEYPHLLVPVDSANPKKAYGTQYNATISSTISSIFNFDVPPSTSGKTCSLVFLFPQQKDLQTSAFTFNGKGGLNVVELKSAATEQTTYENKPAAAGISGTIGSISPGNGYVVFSESCKAGQRVGYEFSGIGGLELEYFQDYNPSPIGAYITVC